MTPRPHLAAALLHYSGANGWVDARHRGCEGSRRRVKPLTLLENKPIEHFDGASQDRKCGRVEFMALWGALYFSLFKRISTLQIVGDSKVIIDWVAGRANL